MNFLKDNGFSIKDLMTGFLVFAVIFGSTLISRNYRIAQSSAIITIDDTSLYLDEDVRLEGLIEKLNSLNIEFDESEFRWVSPLLGWRSFKKGHYHLDGEYSYDNFLTKLAFGSQDPVSITVLPGITAERFARNLAYQMNFDSTDVMEVLTDSVFAEEQDLKQEYLIGRMLPETYDIYWTSTPRATIERILNEFESRVIDKYSDRFDSLDYSVDDVITMASIVEWEANIEDEKPIVAGLYWNRLERRMYLQADPTISFAVGERRRLLLEDYKVDHPYNTYMKYGLPPGPVTNPSLKTIEATLYPQEHNYLYMVANPEGGHLFNRTYEEHLVDAEKWRKWLRQQYRIKRQREQEGL